MIEKVVPSVVAAAVLALAGFFGCSTTTMESGAGVVEEKTPETPTAAIEPGEPAEATQPAEPTEPEEKRPAPSQSPEEKEKAPLPKSFPPGEWVSLFDGKALGKWEPFADEDTPDMYGKVYVENGSMILDAGAPMTGVSWKGNILRDNYEVAVEAMRVAGGDFFCGLTFPVGDAYLTWINGGWGGTVVGLSNVNDFSAVENETTSGMDFEQGRWYQLRLRVTPERIEAWIDGDKKIDLERKDRRFTIWFEQEPCRPFGVTTYATKGAIREISVRALEAKS